RDEKLVLTLPHLHRRDLHRHPPNQSSTDLRLNATGVCGRQSAQPLLLLSWSEDVSDILIIAPPGRISRLNPQKGSNSNILIAIFVAWGLGRSVRFLRSASAWQWPVWSQTRNMSGTLVGGCGLLSGLAGLTKRCT